MEINENPTTKPITPKFGGRYYDKPRKELPAPTNEPIVAAKPPKKESPYTGRGICKITGLHDQRIDAEGISSKGRSRMKSRIRYQTQKVKALYCDRFVGDLRTLKNEGIIDAAVENLVFNGRLAVTLDLKDFDRESASASVYHPPTPRVKKAAPAPTPAV